MTVVRTHRHPRRSEAGRFPFQATAPAVTWTELGLTVTELAERERVEVLERLVAASRGARGRGAESYLDPDRTAVVRSELSTSGSAGPDPQSPTADSRNPARRSVPIPIGHLREGRAAVFWG